MRIGIGLPTAIARSPARLTMEWARLADAGPFASLAAHDALAYDSLEPVTALAAAAAVTQRLHLASLVMIGPLRGRGVMLAKQVRTLAAFAGAGRLTLGLGLGPRRDDYDACGSPVRTAQPPLRRAAGRLDPADRRRDRAADRGP
jgi:alkanesulfonate monooxygenase SsuD/methylene tetrahydromethanopterin reductase-like flavin-dependent oxidoreductase (luciferase family)